MRDYRSSEQTKSGEETANITIPSMKLREVRRKRRTRPAADRFHDLYEFTGELLGQGAQGAVQCCISKASGKEFAVKIINKTIDYNRSKILKEIDIFHHCQGHENILQLNEFYEESEKFYLVFNKLKGGSLFDQIQQRGHFNEGEASEIIRELAEGVAFLHRKGIAHRDLKPENILCEEEDSVTPVRICDFDLGNAIVLKKESAVTTPELMTPVGSLEYMAPEVVDAWVGDAFSYNKKCDIWSLGVILYTMLCGYPPFYASCGQNCNWQNGGSCKACQDILFEAIQDCQYEFPAREWSQISSNAKDLINKMLVRDPSERYTAADILSHPWVCEPVPATSLATPRVLLRNNSTQLLDTIAGNTMACNRMMLPTLALSESQSSSGCSSCGFSDENPFFSPNALDTTQFMVDFSDELDSKFHEYDDSDSDEELDGSFKNLIVTESLATNSQKSQTKITLSLPSSKLAQRRRLSRHI